MSAGEWEADRQFGGPPPAQEFDHPPPAKTGKRDQPTIEIERKAHAQPSIVKPLGLFGLLARHGADGLAEAPIVALEVAGAIGAVAVKLLLRLGDYGRPACRARSQWPSMSSCTLTCTTCVFLPPTEAGLAVKSAHSPPI